MLRSIDLRDVLSKVQAMQEAYQAVIYQAETDQRYFSLYLNQLFVDRQRQPPQISPPQEARIHINEEHRREKQSERRRRGVRHSDEDDLSGQIIDMKV